jgi:hypothetical protein
MVSAVNKARAQLASAPLGNKGTGFEPYLSPTHAMFPLTSPLMISAFGSIQISTHIQGCSTRSIEAWFLTPSWQHF